MAHTKIEHDGKYTVLVDWTTGDKEGDRAYLFKAYRKFLSELKRISTENNYKDILDLFETWHVRELDIDDFPRIGIEYPHDKVKNEK
jgi:hypothetical protein